MSQDLSAENLDMGQSGRRALLEERVLELKIDKNEARRLARLPLTFDEVGKPLTEAARAFVVAYCKCQSDPAVVEMRREGMRLIY